MNQETRKSDAPAPNCEALRLSVGALVARSLRISPFQRGALDKRFAERLWRPVNYEHIDLNPPESGTALKRRLATYFTWHNRNRPPFSLNDKTPDEVYFETINGKSPDCCSGHIQGLGCG